MLTKKNSVDWKEKCDFHTDVVYVDQKKNVIFIVLTGQKITLLTKEKSTIAIKITRVVQCSQ